jgi:hypothetical protein
MENVSESVVLDVETTKLKNITMISYLMYGLLTSCMDLEPFLDSRLSLVLLSAMLNVKMQKGHF